MPEDELVGTTLDGRYHITDLLGRGGMGAVYVADHVGLGRRVAIKFLLATASTDTDARARFQREARAAGKVVHEHVVHVFDVGYAAGRDYIAMEYVDGIDLERVLAAGPLPVARALTITRQLLAGVGAIHAAGFVHRDIKPANIVLAARDDGSDFVKIMDFGVAKTLKAGDDTVTSSGKVVGTLAYMAPEQLTGGTVDHGADLYAVGLTLYRARRNTPRPQRRRRRQAQHLPMPVLITSHAAATPSSQASSRSRSPSTKKRSRATVPRSSSTASASSPSASDVATKQPRTSSAMWLRVPTPPTARSSHRASPHCAERRHRAMPASRRAARRRSR